MIVKELFNKPLPHLDACIGKRQTIYRIKGRSRFFFFVALHFTFSTMLPIIRQIAEEYKAALQQLYGEELSALILFGSNARGDYHEESDIDFAVVLTHAGTGLADIFKTAETSAALGLKYGYALSTLPVNVQKLQQSVQGIYQEIRKEGITI